jgi:hypothetical protein
MADAGNTIGRLGSLIPAEAPLARAVDAAIRPTSASFADLLQLAQAGQVTSDRPVDVSPNLDLELSESESERIAWAVDRAEAAGATSALVMLDGRGFLVDVTTRRIEAIADTPGEVLMPIDAVVIAPREDGSTGSETAGLLDVPLQHLTNQSLRDLLAATTRAAG